MMPEIGTFPMLRKVTFFIDDIDPVLISMISSSAHKLKEVKILGNVASVPLEIGGNSVHVLDLSHAFNISKAKIKVPHGITIITEV